MRHIMLGICTAVLAVMPAAAATTTTAKPRAVNMQLTSPAFGAGKAIPIEYTAFGANRSPALQWRGAPAGTKSFALVCDDPDAPEVTWVHWVVYNLPASAQGLPAGIPQDPLITSGGNQGVNNTGHFGYDGPCPPSGTHRYFFKLYALDTTLSLDKFTPPNAFMDALKGHVLAEAQLMGTFGK